MMNEKAMSTSTLEISVLLVVDTAKIVKYCTDSNITPSTNSDIPTSLPLDTTKASQFLICDSPWGIVSGQGTSALNFIAHSGNLVSFTGTSIEANSDSAVIVYGLTRRSGDEVFNAFNQNWVNLNEAVMPKKGGTGLPPVLKDANFAKYGAMVSNFGTESFDLKFAQYYLDKDTGETQKLYGYFLWDPTITVTKPTK